MPDAARGGLSPFHVMTKPTGPLCNLACAYCFYLDTDRLYPAGQAWRMSEEVLEAYIRQHIDAQAAPVVTFAWQGGEPTLLGVDYFRRVVELQRRHAGGKRIENALQTNGVLLDDRWGEFLAGHRFLVGLSLDGPRELHDRHRVDRGGQPTFDRVLRGLEVLTRHRVDVNTLTAVHRHNARRPLAVYRFLKQVGSRFMQFIPVVERAAGPPGPGRPRLVSARSPEPAAVTAWSVEPDQYGQFLCAIFDEWVREDVGRCFVQLFDVALEAWVGIDSSLCVFRETCGMAMALEHNGDLYACDHFVFPEHRLGNIMETPLATLAGSPRQEGFGRDKRDALPRACRECDVRFACHGECPKHRFARAPDGEGGLSYLCPAYRRFFRHVDPAMTFMAGELRGGRPPANVMAWVRGQGRGRAR